ncbi:MAG TPA: Ig-like domain-containing protein, partial [Gemmatimonadales bacterium]|nr:Ig-like domain-containing protein [Gemmatimonadales bacterium]
MPFGHKLPHRLALLKDRLPRWALLAAPLTFVASCEKPIPTGTTQPPTQLVVFPSSATLQPDQVQDFTAVALTAAGDTAGVSVVWIASGGVVDTNSVGGRHYGHYHNATCGQYTLSATGQPGGVTGSSAITVVCPAPVASLSLLPTAVTLSVGLTQQITATPRDANGNALAGRTITWSTSDASVATVSGSGLVTAVAVGSATITATCEGKTGTTSVTVTAIPVATVTVSPASASVVAGQTQQLTATVRDANGNVLTGRTVSWSSNNAGVANVNGTGLVTAGAAGSATITATSEGKTGTSAITVTAVPVATVSVSPSSASVQVGQTQQLTATPKDANGNPLTGRTITWQSSDNTIAAVNGSGLVTGVAAGGPVTITATSEGKSGTASVTVTASTGTSQFGHVFVVTEENTDYVDVIGSSSMPYLNGLAQQYGLAT